jgi:hypothetical protein
MAQEVLAWLIQVQVAAGVEAVRSWSAVREVLVALE